MRTLNKCLCFMDLELIGYFLGGIHILLVSMLVQILVIIDFGLLLFPCTMLNNYMKSEKDVLNDEISRSQFTLHRRASSNVFGLNALSLLNFDFCSAKICKLTRLLNSLTNNFSSPRCFDGCPFCYPDCFWLFLDRHILHHWNTKGEIRVTACDSK